METQPEKTEQPKPPEEPNAFRGFTFMCLVLLAIPGLIVGFVMVLPTILCFMFIFGFKEPDEGTTLQVTTDMEAFKKWMDKPFFDIK